MKGPKGLYEGSPVGSPRLNHPKVPFISSPIASPGVEYRGSSASPGAKGLYSPSRQSPRSNLYSSSPTLSPLQKGLCEMCLKRLDTPPNSPQRCSSLDRKLKKRCATYDLTNPCSIERCNCLKRRLDKRSPRISASKSPRLELSPSQWKKRRIERSLSEERRDVKSDVKIEKADVTQSQMVGDVAQPETGMSDDSLLSSTSVSPTQNVASDMPEENTSLHDENKKSGDILMQNKGADLKGIVENASSVQNNDADVDEQISVPEKHEEIENSTAVPTQDKITDDQESNNLQEKSENSSAVPIQNKVSDDPPPQKNILKAPQVQSRYPVSSFFRFFRSSKKSIPEEIKADEAKNEEKAKHAPEEKSLCNDSGKEQEKPEDNNVDHQKVATQEAETLKENSAVGKINEEVHENQANEEVAQILKSAESNTSNSNNNKIHRPEIFVPKLVLQDPRERSYSAMNYNESSHDSGLASPHRSFMRRGSLQERPSSDPSRFTPGVPYWFPGAHHHHHHLYANSSQVSAASYHTAHYMMNPSLQLPPPPPPPSQSSPVITASNFPHGMDPHYYAATMSPRLDSALGGTYAASSSSSLSPFPIVYRPPPLRGQGERLMEFEKYERILKVIGSVGRSVTAVCLTSKCFLVMFPGCVVLLLLLLSYIMCLENNLITQNPLQIGFINQNTSPSFIGRLTLLFFQIMR